MGKTFIIINHHRSGSNFLCRLIKANSNIRCLNEPLSMHTGIFKQIDLQLMDEKNMQLFLEKNLECERFLGELKEYMYKSPYTVGFKETVLYGKMRWVLDYFHDIKIIYLVRNPLAVINSALKNDIWKQWDYDKTIPSFLACNGENRKQFSNLELCTLSWKIRYNLFKSEMQDGEYYLLKLEDFMANPNEELGKLMTYIGEIPDVEQYKLINNLYDATQGYAYSVKRKKNDILDAWKEGLNDNEIRFIRQQLAKELQELEYYV